MAGQAIPPIYLLHLWIRPISPMIWRRALVRSDSTLAQLHDVIQIAFDWSDTHLHRFRIHGRDYGVNRLGGLWFPQEAGQVRLADFQFRERLLESVDAGDREAVRDQLEAIESLREWLDLDRFDRGRANRRLRQYAAGDEGWRCP